MKILHFITSIDKSAGGTTAYIHLLSNELKNLVDLVVVTGESANPVELEGVRVVFLDLSMYRFFKFKKEFLHLLELEKPDIVHINGIWQPQTGLFQDMAQESGIKVVLSPHGMLEQYILDRHPMKKRLALAMYQRKAIRNADYLQATAKPELDQIRSLGFSQQAIIIPNGIEVADIKPKTEWNEVRNILFLSRVHSKKGLELLIKAVASLHNSTLHITIAGEGEDDYMESLNKLTVELHVSDQVEFTGGVYGNQKWELYRHADLFVLPTYSENFGIVVAEALATGLPVITTTGTPWQELETRQCGWWIDLSVSNLAGTITEAIKSTPEQLKTMGQNGRKLVKERYEIKAVANKMFVFYKQAIKFRSIY